MKLSPFLERRQRALQIIAEASAPIASLSRPGVRIKGTTNGSQGVTLAGRRARRGKQRGLKDLGRNAAQALKLKALVAKHGALVVRVVRVAPNRLDGDNLEASLKRVRDGVAKTIGIDDRHPSVEYVADDERGAVREYAVRFEVFPQRATGDADPPRINDSHRGEMQGWKHSRVGPYLDIVWTCGRYEVHATGENSAGKATQWGAKVDGDWLKSKPSERLLKLRKSYEPLPVPFRTVRDAKLFCVRHALKADADKFTSLKPLQVTLDQAIEWSRSNTPTPNVKKPRVTR